ncbi:ABC transporter ATP-binding protein [Erysipelothrix urinaevulpis]|uniref:ABC transporter ATP-binding protein n=1 Tax=Erysipelothrix urinaevulpis TaxID=2683717 RepID=UPI00135BA9A5|nr:ABC transporter ATP-binding protein [Erysipelothrix urinaevulpis]
MKRIFSHLKPFVSVLLLAIVLLFVQAFADLKLPNYMSDIVNVGIQQNGIEHASPDRLTQDGMDFIVSLLPEKQGNTLKDMYTKEKELYIVKTDIDRDQADLLVGEAAWTMMNIAKESGQTSLESDLSGDFNPQELYQLTPMFQLMDKTSAYEEASKMEDSLKLQTGVVFSKMFYKDLDVSLDSMQNKYILKTGGIMMVITLIGMVATIGVSYFSSKIGAGFARSLRKDVFEKVESFSNGEFDEFSSSSLVVRTTNDVNQIQQVILMGIRMFFYAPIMAIGGIIMILNRDTTMVWIIIVAVAALAILLGVVFIVAVPKFKIMQDFVDRLNLVFRENLSGVMVIRAFGNHDFENKRFDKANKDKSDLTLFVNRLMSLMMPLMMFMMNITMLSIIWFGSQQISDGLLQIGDMMAFMQYTMQIIFSFLMISMMFIFIPRAIVSMNRIDEVLSKENAILDPEKSIDFIEDKTGYVEFKNVSFKYGDAKEYVLEAIDFVAKPGQTTAIIGSTGSGKSTLIGLIPRFFDVVEGEVLVNGVNVEAVYQHDLREQIAYIPQKGILISGDVESNLKYGKADATEEEMIRALKIAQSDFVLNSDEGLSMAISQGGTNVSGGQKQRLSIARAVVKNAPIYIFDDSFSALDFKTDQNLRQALHENLENANLIIVAQRVNTILDADQILVLDEGRLVGKGTHSELLKSCETYYEIASSQLTKEELENERR